MHLVRAVLTRRSSAPPSADGRELVDILWAHALPEDGLEHARCRLGPDRADLALFIRETEHSSPVQQAAALLGRCHSASAVLTATYEQPTVCQLPPPF
jgi:hypothetical protein